MSSLLGQISVLRLLALAGALAYLVLCGPGAASPVVFWDSSDYAWVAEHLSPFSLDFFVARKPFTLPLLFWLTRGDHGNIVIAQIVVSALSWLALACSLPRLFASRSAKVLAFALPLLLSLSWPVRNWNYCLLSESLCFSLLAAVLATSLRLVHSERRSRAAWAMWASLLVLWGGTRDTVAYAISVAGAGLSFWGVTVWALVHLRARAAGSWRAALAAGAFMTCLALGLFTMTKASGRWRLNVLNAVSMRVLPDREIRSEWAERYGMPDGAGLRAFAGRWPWEGLAVSHDADLYDIVKFQRGHSEEMRAFYAWIEARGLDAARNHVLRHPLRSVRSAVVEYARLPEHDAYLVEMASSPVSRAAAFLFFPELGGEKVMLFLTVLFAAWVGGKRRALLWAAVLGFTALVQLLVSYHGDPHNLIRHTFIVGILLRVVVIVLFCGALDSLRRSSEK